MVNLPPNPNERRDRDQILSFDEFLAVGLALLGIGSILWWGMSRGRSLLDDGFPMGQISQPPTVESDADGDRLGTSEAQSPLFEPDLFETGNARDVQPSVRMDDNRDRGLPSLADSSPRVNTASRAGESEPEPVPLEPAFEPEPLAEPPLEAVTPPPLNIGDVPEDHWAYPFIKDMFDQGYLPDFPSGQFEPDKALTRAELASLLNEAFVADPAERDPLNFEDVSSDYWAADAVDQVVERGFMSGYPNSEFKPDQFVPRYQVLVTLASGLDLADPANVDQSLQGFTDLDALPDWARPQVAASAQNGLIVNYPNPDQLKPGQTATRAEIVAMMHQALVQEGKLEPIESDYIIPPPQDRAP